MGDLYNVDSIREVMEGIYPACLVYPVQPGLIDATVHFAQAAKEAVREGTLEFVETSRTLLETKQNNWSPGIGNDS